MNAKTLKALKESIAHWRRLATGKQRRDEEPFADECALCGLFNDIDTGCEGCPVHEKTGETLCKGTPYPAAFDAWQNSAPDFRTKARAELKFLESLLPKKPK